MIRYVHDDNPHSIYLFLFCQRFVNNQVVVIVVSDKWYTFIPYLCKRKEFHSFGNIYTETIEESNRRPRSKDLSGIEQIEQIEWGGGGFDRLCWDWDWLTSDRLLGIWLFLAWSPSCREILSIGGGQKGQQGESRQGLHDGNDEEPISISG